MKRLLLFPLLALVGCLPKVDKPCTKSVPSIAWTSLNQTQLQADILAIDNYLDTHTITAVEDVSGLRYVITTAGTGGEPCLETNISFTYKGKLLSNGTVFDSSATPIAYNLNQLIVGWQIGFLKFNKGTKATLYIPSGLGYGASAVGSIPANSNLIFDIELVSF